MRFFAIRGDAHFIIGKERMDPAITPTASPKSMFFPKSLMLNLILFRERLRVRDMAKGRSTCVTLHTHSTLQAVRCQEKSMYP